MAKGIGDAARRWSKKQRREGKAEAKKASHFVSDGESKTELYVRKVVTHALHYLRENVDHEIRKAYKGESDFQMDLASGNVLVKITLTYISGDSIIQTALITAEDLRINGDSLAALVGDRLGAALADRLLDQQKKRYGKGEWKQEYDSERHYEEESQITERIEGKFEDVQPTKPKKPRTVCKICGETDDKYPEWEGDCEHVIRNRKEAERKSSAARKRVARSKGAAKVRREAVASASGYAGGRKKRTR